MESFSFFIDPQNKTVHRRYRDQTIVISSWICRLKKKIKIKYWSRYPQYNWVQEVKMFRIQRILSTLKKKAIFFKDKKQNKTTTLLIFSSLCSRLFSIPDILYFILDSKSASDILKFWKNILKNYFDLKFVFLLR